MRTKRINYAGHSTAIQVHRTVERPVNVPNTVVRQACDRYGQVLGYFTTRYDGSPETMIAAAKRVTEAMFLAFDEVSNISSAILATDAAGQTRWTISPNFRVITEIDPV